VEISWPSLPAAVVGEISGLGSDRGAWSGLREPLGWAGRFAFVVTQ